MTAAWRATATRSAQLGGDPAVDISGLGIVNGDLLVAVAAASAGATITMDAAWTLRGESLGGNLRIWTRTASSEPSSYTLTVPGATAASIISIGRYDGHDPTNPIDFITAVSNTTATLVIPEGTSLGINRLLAQILVKGNNGTFTPPGTTTERYDALSATQNFVCAGGDEVVGSGLTGTRTWTASVSSGIGFAVMLALKPAPQTITVGLLASSSQVFTPSLALGVEVGLLASTSQVFTPAVVAVVEPSRIESAAAVFAPAVGFVIEPSRVESTSTVFTPTWMQQVDVDRIESTSTVFEPSVSASIDPARIESASVVYAPSVAALIEPPAIASTSTVYTPTLGQVIELARIESTAAVFAATLSQGITVPRVESTATVYRPRINYVPAHHKATVREVAQTHAIAEVTQSHTIADKSRKTTVREGIA